MSYEGQRLLEQADTPVGGVRKKRSKAPWVLTVAAGVLAVNLYISNCMLQLSRYTVVLPRLPGAFDGFRIILLSDWHNAMFGKDNSALLDMVRGERPDLIALSGDFVEHLSELHNMETLCRGLAAIAPTYFVTGNHEWAGKITRQARDLVRACGVVSLDNDYEFISRDGQSICVIGIEDLNGPRDQLTLAEVTAQARRGGDPFLLMLCHRYDRFDEFVAQRVDLALTGHAHGGVIRLPFTDGIYGPGRVFFPQHTSGVSREKNTVMVASRGLGTEGRLPLRLFNRPEVVSITLKTGSP